MAMRCNDLRVLSSRLNNTDAGLARMISKLQGTELRHELEALAIDARRFQVGCVGRDVEFGLSQEQLLLRESIDRFLEDLS